MADPTQNDYRQSHLCCTQVYRRTGHWHYQRGSWLPSILLTWGTTGRGRVVSGLSGLQSQAFSDFISGNGVMLLRSPSQKLCAHPPIESIISLHEFCSFFVRWLSITSVSFFGLNLVALASFLLVLWSFSLYPSHACNLFSFLPLSPMTSHSVKASCFLRQAARAFHALILHLHVPKHIVSTNIVRQFAPPPVGIPPDIAPSSLSERPKYQSYNPLLCIFCSLLSEGEAKVLTVLLRIWSQTTLRERGVRFSPTDC
jgi:hypothetical protein